jgi:chromosome segregation ATPase
MNGESTPLSLEECFIRCREVDSQRDGLLGEIAALAELNKVLQQEIAQVVAEMEKLGTSPQTIRADMANIASTLSIKTLNYETETRRIAAEITKVRQAIAALDQSFLSHGK